MDDISAQLLIATGQRLAGIQIGGSATKEGEDPVLFTQVVPDGMKVTDITDIMLSRRTHPRRRTGVLKMQSPTSLVGIVNRYKEPLRTAIFADSTQRRVVAVLNFHEPTVVLDLVVPDTGEASQIEDTFDLEALPQWGDFRATYSFPLSRQWGVWRNIDGKLLGQGELAQFIEDNIRDIADPDVTPIPDSTKLLIQRLNLNVGTPTKLLEVARGFEIRATEKLRSALNTDTGETALVYEQAHDQGNPTVTEMRVPTAFLLTIPVFQNDAPYLLLCRLRYRKAEGVVRWLINIQGADAALEDAFARGCQAIEDGTGVPLFFAEEPAGVRP